MARAQPGRVGSFSTVSAELGQDRRESGANVVRLLRESS